MGWFILEHIFSTVLATCSSRRVQKPHPKHYRYEFWDRGFVKSCPIMGTAERNLFSPLFSR